MEDNIKEIINEFDPLQVLPYAPNDEYELEIKIIVKYLENIEKINVESFALFIYEIFTKNLTQSAFFNTLDECKIVAKKIIDIL